MIVADIYMFDYEAVAKEAGIPDDKIAALADEVRLDYPGDEMLFELRMLRTCSSIREGRATVETAIEGFRSTRR